MGWKFARCTAALVGEFEALWLPAEGIMGTLETIVKLSGTEQRSERSYDRVG